MLRNPYRRRERAYTIEPQEPKPKIHQFCIYTKPDFRLKDELSAAGAKDVHVGREDENTTVLTFFRYAPSLLEALQSALGQLAKTRAQLTGISAVDDEDPIEPAPTSAEEAATIR